MTRLVLIRHGQSRWNAEGRIQGQACEGLSTLGRAQARVTAAALASSYPDARLVTSDLQRTRETTAPFELEFGREAEVDARLRERAFGAWEGRLRRDVAVEEAARWTRFRAGDEVMDELGGETTDALVGRVTPVLRALLDDAEPDEVVVAVTHGGPIWHGLHDLLDLPHPSLGGVANCSITELISWDAPVEGVTARSVIALDRFNELGHLPAELRTAWQPRGGRNETLAQDADRAGTSPPPAASPGSA
ncbi:MAG: histidine phosphatase family protein [Nitriliruptoraceae bacterium]|nr:histidine phosphatase family protein [Nitriliruptoraceae bacterium]